MATTTIDLQAVTKNFVMDQGKSFEVPFAVTRNDAPLDMTGYILRAQFRKSVSNPDVVINCTQANGKIAFVDDQGGTFLLRLLPSDTSYAGNPKVSFSKDSPDELELVYDIEAETITGIVYPVCKGTLTIHREVTR